MTDKKVQASAEDVADDVVEYNALVHAAELNDITLIDMKFTVKPEYFSWLREESAGKKKLTRAFDGSVSEVFFDSESHMLGGQFDWVTEVKAGNKRLLKIEARYLIVYGNVPETSPVCRDRYMQRVAKFATYPYFRSLVAQISWESKADLPVMPVLK